MNISKRLKLKSRYALVEDIFIKLFPNKFDLELYTWLRKIGKEKIVAKNQNFLVQMPWDYAYLFRIAIFLKIFRPEKLFGVHIYFPTKFHKNPIRKWFLKFQLSKFLNYKWNQLYSAFGIREKLDYRNAELHSPASIPIKEIVMQYFRSKDELSRMKFEDMLVGDLIYDTYIRFKPAPTLNLSDPFLEFLVDQTIAVYLECKSFLLRNKVDALVTTYAAYTHHGILTRLCLAHKIKVYAVCAGNQLVAYPTPDYPFHRRNFHQYKKWADQYPDQNELFNLSKKYIENRINGVIDPSTSYMKESAYKQTENSITLHPERKSAVIMAHDFYDSPHAWGDMICEDLYEWLEFVLSVASETEHDFYLKPHPNAVAGSKEIYDYFFKKYPKIIRIDPATSNATIANAGFTCAITLFGTIAHEFSYLGLPTISGGENPHSAFNFTKTPKTKDELRMLIQELKPWIPDQSEVLKFVFMHNYCYLKDNIPPVEGIYSTKELMKRIKGQYQDLDLKMKKEFDAALQSNSFY